MQFPLWFKSRPSLKHFAAVKEIEGESGASCRDRTDEEYKVNIQMRIHLHFLSPQEWGKQSREADRGFSVAAYLMNGYIIKTQTVIGRHTPEINLISILHSRLLCRSLEFMRIRILRPVNTAANHGEIDLFIQAQQGMKGNSGEDSLRQREETEYDLQWASRRWIIIWNC